MRKFLALICFTSLVLTSCSNEGPPGPEGPQGPQGPEGPAGPATFGTVVDIEGDFTADNDYSLFLDFNDAGIEVFETDAVLVYTKVGENGTSNGQPVEVWRQLPQTYFLDDGTPIQYNFDYTFFDVNIWIEYGNKDLSEYSNLDGSWTDGLVFRVVVVPSDFAENTNVDVSDYNAVAKQLQLNDSDIQTLSTHPQL